MAFTAGTTNVAGTYNVTGATQVSGSGTVNFNSVAASTVVLTVSGGTLQGSGTLTITGLFSWSGGAQAGTGVTNANGGMSISGTGTKTLATRTLNHGNNGMATWTGTGNINFNTSATLNNLMGATFDIQNNESMLSVGTFNNMGTLTKSAGAAVTAITAVLNNSGTVDAQTGTLSLNGGG